MSKFNFERFASRVSGKEAEDADVLSESRKEKDLAVDFPENETPA